MKFIKRLRVVWNHFICFLFGHTQTVICKRCGKFVDLAGKKKLTLEGKINAWWKNRKTLKSDTEYKGSLKLVPGLKKYSINIKTNELREVIYTDEVISWVLNPDGTEKKDADGNPIPDKVKHKAEHNQFCVYIDAMNDAVAIRKANNYMYSIKDGVEITKVMREPLTPKGEQDEDHQPIKVKKKFIAPRL